MTMQGLFQQFILMNQKLKRSSTLPEVISNYSSYVFRAIQLAKLCNQDKNKNILIDQGYGDKNIALFRRKAKKKIIQEVPTAFTHEIRQLLQCKIDSPIDISIANAHNQEIYRILNKPKEQYKLGHKDEQKMRQKRQLQQRQQNKKGIDTELRYYNEHLSFGYLPAYQQDNWFTIKDNSKDYQPLPIIFPKTPAISIREHSQIMKTQRKSKFIHHTPSKPK